jgi:hypothetical protein
LALMAGGEQGGHVDLLEAARRAELAVGLGVDGRGVRSVAEAAYATLLPYADLTVVSGAAVSFHGAVAHHLGVLARTLGDTTAAAEHLACAVAVHERLGATTWTLRSRFELARTRTASPAVFTDLAEHAACLGMAALARDARAVAAPAAGAFHRKGTQWTLDYAGATAKLRDSKGLADLAVLLSHPGCAVPAADLAVSRDQLAAVGAPAPGTGLPDQLGDHDERARKAVTARIRDALGRIERVHPMLGAHLHRSVTTGRLCCYTPPTPVTWRI